MAQVAVVCFVFFWLPFPFSMKTLICRADQEGKHFLSSCLKDSTKPCTERGMFDGGSLESVKIQEKRNLSPSLHCCCSAAQSCPTLCDSMDRSTPGPLSFTVPWSLLKLMSIGSVIPSNHLILCHPLLLLLSNFPSIRVFSNEEKRI